MIVLGMNGLVHDKIFERVNTKICGVWQNRKRNSTPLVETPAVDFHIFESLSNSVSLAPKFICSKRRTFECVAMGKRTWLSLEWKDLFISSKRRTFGHTEMGKNMVVLGMKRLVHQQQKEDIWTYWNGQENMAVLGMRGHVHQQHQEDIWMCYNGQKLRLSKTNDICKEKQVGDLSILQ